MTVDDPAEKIWIEISQRLGVAFWRLCKLGNHGIDVFGILHISISTSCDFSTP